MATSIHPSIPVLSPTIPIFPLSFTCLLPFFGCTLHINLFYTLRNILPEAICCCFVLLELSNVCMPTFIPTIANMDQLFGVIA